jgi:hypothetical protein
LFAFEAADAIQNFGDYTADIDGGISNVDSRISSAGELLTAVIRSSLFIQCL